MLVSMYQPKSTLVKVLFEPRAAAGGLAYLRHYLLGPALLVWGEGLRPDPAPQCYWPYARRWPW
ncbi:MAG: hypothetical protein WKG07_17655 [Hymenobacter sp.]